MARVEHNRAILDVSIDHLHKNDPFSTLLNDRLQTLQVAPVQTGLCINNERDL